MCASEESLLTLSQPAPRRSLLTERRFAAALSSADQLKFALDSESSEEGEPASKERPFSTLRSTRLSAELLDAAASLDCASRKEVEKDVDSSFA